MGATGGCDLVRAIRASVIKKVSECCVNSRVLATRFTAGIPQKKNPPTPHENNTTQQRRKWSLHQLPKISFQLKSFSQKNGREDCGGRGTGSREEFNPVPPPRHFIT
jgi:hypothetical protein